MVQRLRDRLRNAVQPWREIEPESGRETPISPDAAVDRAEQTGRVIVNPSGAGSIVKLWNMVEGQWAYLGVPQTDATYYLGMVVYRCSVRGCFWTSIKQGQFADHAKAVNQRRALHKDARPHLVGDGGRSVFRCLGCGVQGATPMRLQTHIDGARALPDHSGAREMIGPMYAMGPPLVAEQPVSTGNGGNGHRFVEELPQVGSGGRRRRSRGRRRSRSR